MLIYWKNKTIHQRWKQNGSNWNSGKNMPCNFTIKSSFFDGINYWTWDDFWKQFRHQRNTEKIITSICKGNTIKQDMLHSQIHLTRQALTRIFPSKQVSKCQLWRLNFENNLRFLLVIKAGRTNRKPRMRALVTGATVVCQVNIRLVDGLEQAVVAIRLKKFSLIDRFRLRKLATSQDETESIFPCAQDCA